MTTTDRRVFSNDPRHVCQDLATALGVALRDDADPRQREQAAAILASIDMGHDVGDTEKHELLKQVATTLGGATLGSVLRFHLEAGTSLCPQSEIAVSENWLGQLGLTLEDLGWPASIMHPSRLDDAAPEDPTFEEHLATAVETWTTTVASEGH